LSADYRAAAAALAFVTRRETTAAGQSVVELPRPDFLLQIQLPS